ncbi:TPA: hypothetical protein N0F65_006990 [Lagenidium giganteum]|uniref:PIPK domain-containing protein n=1 Tax=Lagenidium giganteum TaxID=4803 RepID=A0AAV2ZD94_9STRA|nr:TPA: hypothetical protein N0F65_006990 [Lagenidium giganteum]
MPPPVALRRLQSYTKTVIIVVNVLPLVFERNAEDTGWDVEWSSSATSMFYRNLVGESEQYRPLFVGCPEMFIAKEEESAVEKQLRAFNCVPVFLEPTEAHRYFQGFCKGVLWPIFHNVVDVYNSAQLNLDSFPDDVVRGGKKPSSIGTSDLNNKSGAGDNASNEKASGSGTTATKPKRSRSQSWCDPASWNPAAQDKCWNDYCNVNRTFAKRVIENYHDGNLVWIQDCHFLMLPSYLLRKLRGAVIAVYLHVPFPSSEIFRCLAMRTEILRAMLCADHIGFLIFEHARHFLTSCKRLLGLSYKTSENGMLVVEYNGRKVCITCSHIEPDIAHLHNILDHTDVNEEASRFKKRIEKCTVDANKKRKTVITSVDRLEGLNALPLKLRAFDRFLANNPDKRKSLVLVQIGLSLDSRPNDYQQTREYVHRFVQEINSRWAPPGEVVVYFEERAKTTCMERMNLWRMSDVFLDTCHRSGLSFLPFEYLVAQKRNHELARDSSRQFGCMVVSEFASYSRVLNGCILVNPWKTDDIVSALVKATEMHYYEKHNRFQLSYKFLVSSSESKWAERMLADFEATLATKQHSDAGETIEVGFGFDYRVMQFVSGFNKLDVDDVVRKCTKASQRLFVFDYGGTLSFTTSILDESAAAHHHHRNGAVEQNVHCKDLGDRTSAYGQDDIRFMDGQVRTPLSDEVRENIRTLCDDPHNIVFIVSTGRRAELDAEFGRIANINLISDNGFFLKKAGGSNWECIYSENELNLDWKDEVTHIMKAYAARTNGAYLIVNEASLLYDYRNSDPEYGEIQALELYEQLRHLLKRGEATVHRAKGFVEVHQFGVNKSVAISLVLSYLKDKVAIPDFVFCAGDDESDELGFRALQSFAERESGLENLFTCTVGMKPSSAKYYVDSLNDVLMVIHAIAVRQRLESSRCALFTKQCFFDIYMNKGSLVSPRFIRSLSVESLGTEQSEPLMSGLEEETTRSLNTGIDGGSRVRVVVAQVQVAVAKAQPSSSRRSRSTMGGAKPTETDELGRDKEYATFCSISLSSEPRGSTGGIEDIAKLQAEYEAGRMQKKNKKTKSKKRGRLAQPKCYAGVGCQCCVGRRTVRGFVWFALLLFMAGIAGILTAVSWNYTTDQYLFIGALVSFCFSMVVMVCYSNSRAVRSHPNPLIFSKSLVDFLLACLYIVQFCITEFSTEAVVLPFRIAALTQALLVAGEFWFFAMPIDLLQSITNPFTSYSHNFRVYWFYSTLSGIICGVAFWCMSDEDPSASQSPKSRCKDGAVNCTIPQPVVLEHRYYWFHSNTDLQGFFWHRWLSYHIWVLVYLIFCGFCIVFVKRRLHRGLEETFEIRKRVLTNGLVTCSIYIFWSLMILCLFAMTNSSAIKDVLGKKSFQQLVNSTPLFSFLPMSMKEMQFYDFQPRVFASIRHMYGIDDAEYVFAFRRTANERISEGRSGAFIFNTCDRKYLVKSMTSSEKAVLLELFPKYVRYLQWNPNTLLPRFFGFHAMKMYGQIFYFVVMGNILSTTEVIHRRYDIKGSWVDRNAPACVLGEKYRCSKCNRFFVFGDRKAASCESTGAEHYADIVLRDNDLKMRLKLEPGTASQLLKQLTRDSNFLASNGIMDYSLLIGIHYAQFVVVGETTAPRPGATEHMPVSRNNSASCNDGGSLVLMVREDSFPIEDASDVQLQRQFSSVEGPSIRLHRYCVNQVSGPGTYYFGLVDILQRWTIGKQAERVYKTTILRKDPRGLSAIGPRPYATRFQQKMAQLFVTTPVTHRASVDLSEDHNPIDQHVQVVVTQQPDQNFAPTTDDHK